MAVEAISISDKFFFWRCGDCGWESEKFPVSSKNVPPPHKCDDKTKLMEQKGSWDY